MEFVDKLVEAILKGDRVKIDLNNVEDAQSKRHGPGLKYMVTELTCNCTGGPEIVTSKGFDDAKLGVPAEQWPTFLEGANEAAMLWPAQLLRTSLLNALAEQGRNFALMWSQKMIRQKPKPCAISRWQDLAISRQRQRWKSAGEIRARRWICL